MEGEMRSREGRNPICLPAKVGTFSFVVGTLHYCLQFVSAVSTIKKYRLIFVLFRGVIDIFTAVENEK
jgi:hypothetical protein